MVTVWLMFQFEAVKVGVLGVTMPSDILSLETENSLESAINKLNDKSCDWIIANSTFNGKESVFDSDMNSVKFIDKKKSEDWGYMTKANIADKICKKISNFFDEAA